MKMRVESSEREEGLGKGKGGRAERCQLWAEIFKLTLLKLTSYSQKRESESFGDEAEYARLSHVLHM